MNSKFVSVFLSIIMVTSISVPITQDVGEPRESLSGGGGGGLADSPWPMFRQNLNHTGQSPYDTSGNIGKLKWSFTCDDIIHLSPAIDSDGMIYIGTDNNKLYAITPDGTEKWNFTTYGAMWSSPAIGFDGTIYIGSDDGKLYAINPDGSEKWSFITNGWIWSSPAIGFDGTIYIGSDDYNLYAINPDGSEKWSFSTSGWVRSSPAISFDDIIYIGSFDGKLYAINLDGSEKWCFTTGDNVQSSPAIDSDGTIYIGSFDGKLYAINPDGTEKWSFTTGEDIRSSPAISSDGTIYVGSDDHKLYAINPDGTEKWSFITGWDVHSSPAIGSDGTVYIGSEDFKLYAFNPNGTLKWNFITGFAVRSSPVINSDGTIYIASEDKKLYAIGTSAPTQPPVAIAGPGQTVNEGDVVQFDGSLSYAPVGIIDSYEWDFDADVDSDGDGNPINDVDGTGPTPTHIYGDDGVYDVTLTVMAKVEDGGVVKNDQDVIFCVDVSGSMSWESVNLSKEGVSTYVDELLQPDQGAVVVFGYNTGEPVRLLNPLTDNYTQLLEDIQSIPEPQGGTDIATALMLAIDEILLNGNGSHIQVIILLTDGSNNAGPDPVLYMADQAAVNNITIFTIGLEPDTGYPYDEETLMKVANITGGEYYYAPDATYLKTIYQQIAQKVEYPNVVELFDTDTMLVTVNNVEPTIDPFGSFISDEGLPINFPYTVIDPGSDDLTFTWSWGDGTLDTVATYYNNGIGPEPLYDFMINEIKSPEGTYPFSITDAVSHTYGDNGVYTITLTVADDDDGTTVITAEVLVNNVWPTISVIITPIENEGSELTFEAEANDPGSDDLTFKWEFEYGPTIENTYYNDGINPEPIYDPGTNEIKSSEGTFPFIASDSITHTYGDDYNYSLILTVADDDNGASSYNTTIKIDNVAPSITMVMIPNPVYEGSALTFGARAEDQGSDDLTFQWDFGDSTPINTMTHHNDGVGPDPYPSPEGTYPFTATDTLDHTYGDNYDYSLTLTVTDDDGLSTTFTTKIIVYNVAPTIDQFGPFIINEGEPITITGTATDPGSDDLMFTWEFEYGPIVTNIYYNDGVGPDPSPSPKVNPMDILDYVSHTYGDDGVFNVTLTVEDDDGDATTYTTNITVNNVAPTVTIESVTMNMEVGLRVAGRKYNNVSMTLYEAGNLIGGVSIERTPGSPDEQMAWIPVNINFSRSYNATVTYTPEDPPDVGGNPVWIYLKSQDGSIKKIHHTFNVQQSKKRDSEHWNHVEPWEVDLNTHLIGCEFEVNYIVTDPGSDDEILTFTYHSQIKTVTYLNNPPNPDLFPSPEVNPRYITDTITLVYEGLGTITLVVKDDDNIRLGIGQDSDAIDLA